MGRYRCVTSRHSFVPICSRSACYTQLNWSVSINKIKGGPRDKNIVSAVTSLTIRMSCIIFLYSFLSFFDKGKKNISFQTNKRGRNAKFSYFIISVCQTSFEYKKDEPLINVEESSSCYNLRRYSINTLQKKKLTQNPTRNKCKKR